MTPNRKGPSGVVRRRPTNTLPSGSVSASAVNAQLQPPHIFYQAIHNHAVAALMRTDNLEALLTASPRPKSTKRSTKCTTVATTPNSSNTPIGVDVESPYVNGGISLKTSTPIWVSLPRLSIRLNAGTMMATTNRKTAIGPRAKSKPAISERTGNSPLGTRLIVSQNGPNVTAYQALRSGIDLVGDGPSRNLSTLFKDQETLCRGADGSPPTARPTDSRIGCKSQISRNRPSVPA